MRSEPCKLRILKPINLSKQFLTGLYALRHLFTTLEPSPMEPMVTGTAFAETNQEDAFANVIAVGS